MIGETVSHYRVDRELGHGGMGVVYQATDILLGRQVALKLLRPEETADPDRRARFLHEAKTASGLNHPNIVTIYEVGYVGDTIYIAMELVAGATMERLVAPGGLPLGDILRFAIQIADALAAAHAADVVHRDLKPANIMVTSEERVKLLDFGLAKAPPQDLDKHAQSITRSVYAEAPRTRDGLIVGTVGYMSPEQLEGRAVDQRTDIFAFGCVLYELITGRPAFRGDTPMSTLIAVASREPASMPGLRSDVPPGLERLVLQCLRKDPAERPQMALDVKRDLEALARILGSRRTLFRKAAGDFARSARRHVRIGAAAALLLAASAAGLWYWRTNPANPSPLSGLTQLTADPGLSSYPAVSFDGRLLAYASDRSGDGALDIWTKPLSAGGRPTRLTSDPTDDYEPSFSPDGRLIAFRSERGGGGVYTVPATGGAEQLIADNGRQPRFSPDGKWIAYTIGTTGGGELMSRIFLVPVAGGPSREWEADFGSRANPVWSPDSTRILFFGTAANTPWFEGTDWWSAPVEGGPVIRTGAVAQLRDKTHSLSPIAHHWRPDNGIVFSRPSDTGISIWQMRLDPATWKVTGSPEQLTQGDGVNVQPAVGPGGRLLFAHLTESLNIWALPLDSTRGTPSGQLTRVTGGGPVLDTAPWITPDGKTMAFISNRQGREEVWTRDLETGRQVALTNSPGLKVFPILDQTGSRLAYGEAREKTYAIQVMAPPGGLPKLVCADCGQPRGWVPESDQILFQTGTPSTFWAVDVTTGARQRVAAYEGFGIYSPRFSFDGRWLVFFARVQSDATRIVIAPYRGVTGSPTEWIHVTRGVFDDDKPRWAPGDRAIYFLSLRDGFRCLWEQRLDPETKRPVGDPQVLMHFHRPGLGMMSIASHRLDLAVARDKMLLTLAERTGDIWMEPAGNPR